MTLLQERGASRWSHFGQKCRDRLGFPALEIPKRSLCFCVGGPLAVLLLCGRGLGLRALLSPTIAVPSIGGSSTMALQLRSYTKHVSIRCVRIA